MDTRPLEHEILQNAGEACKRETGIEVKIKYAIKAKEKADARIVVHYHDKKVISLKLR